MDELHYRNDLLEVINEQHIENERMYRAICKTIDCAIIYYHFPKDRYQVMGKWEQFFSFPFETGKDFFQLYDLFEEEEIPVLKETLFPEKSGIESSLTILKEKDGTRFFEFHVVLVFEDEEITDKIILISDVTKREQRIKEIDFMENYDVLTGLYNRKHFLSILVDWIMHASKDNTLINVLSFDIKDFRKINDHGGVSIGDEIIQKFSRILSEFSSDQVLIARFHADIFYMAIKDPVGSQSVESICNRIFEKTKKPFVLSNKSEATIDISVGVAEFPEKATSAAVLLRYAEIALFKAKDLGTNNFYYFNQSILNAFLATVEFEQQLSDAVKNEEFYIHFQPQFQAKTKKLRGVEALLRWKNKEGQQISPQQFIPIAEKNGMIITLGKFVIRESIRIFSEWNKKFQYPMILSINISALQFNRGDLVLDIIESLERYEIEPRQVEIEITESILIHDLNGSKEKMNILRNMGIKVSMDDFGTGYSSLAYLSGLPIDTLKIDKSFIDTVFHNDSTKIIIESILGMVKRLGIETVAEGVETKEQFDFLNEMDCDCIQGYYLGKPMDAERITQLIMKEM